MVSPLSRGHAPRRHSAGPALVSCVGSGFRGPFESRASAPVLGWSRLSVRSGGQSRDRSDDLTLFRRALYQLSYLTKTPAPSRWLGAGSADLTGFEPAASGLTGRRALLAAPQVRTADETLAPQIRTHSRLRVRPLGIRETRSREEDAFSREAGSLAEWSSADGSATVKMLGDG